MNVPANQSERKEMELEEAQRVQRWARTYAQNRSLHVAVGLAVFALLWAAISVPSYLGGMAYRAGNMPLLVVCVAVLIVAMAATIYVSFPRWGGRLMQRLAEGLYAREGQVTVSSSHRLRPWWGVAIGSVFGLCVVGTVVLGVLGYLPDRKYSQPISAIYVVPFLLCLGFVLRPITGYIPLLWPLLYALHAVLIVAGAPIVFTGPWESLNMLVPVVGYGVLTSLIGHLYSRWALHNVRAIVSRQLDRADLADREEA